ncbi:sigma-70 family RNA polymerase sigma factor [Diaminobutyricibacter tongyongensis]|uniref:sigma-70 family RNA polymerase sigma factor n=1 Tax=Leifsonia tongyongensis TaxID=1268043 RepID=UPI001962DEE3|nr:sigma-70 family RNA polymerase sigma factor [Diaminobutyricibacter tongyongensis]
MQHDDGGDELADTSIGIDEYFRKITQVELLSAKEEIALSMRIESGLFAKERLEVSHDLHSDDEPLLRWLVRDGARANETMLLANTRLAANIARSYQGQGLELADLIQVGNLGLIRAIQKFDYKLGYKFSTYATWWIRQQISRSIADLGRTIRLPVHVVDHLRKVQAARRVLESGSPETANTSQISGVSGLGESLVTSLRSWSEDVFSLEYIRDELGEEIVDDGEDVFLSVENRLDLKRLLDMVLGTMSEKEAQVFALRHGLDGGDPQTLEQIGACQGLTRERIRQIETKAAKRARFQIAPDL